MAMPDNAHWKDSLLGESFWREQELLNQPIEARVEADRARALHRRFPFNLSMSEETAPALLRNGKKKRRRFSTSDARNLDTVASESAVTVGSTLAGNVSGDGNIEDRDSLSSTSYPHSWTNFIRRVASLLRVSLKHISIADFSASTSTSSRDSHSISSILATPIQKDLGPPGKPLLCFRGGASWNCLPRVMETLCIDLFWPVKNLHDKEREKETGMLDTAQMAPLCEFRNLRVLRITGMMQSYQRYIWQAAWLNPGLVELELGMALPPRLGAGLLGTLTEWPVIKGEWKVDKSHSRNPVYYGGLGDGNLHPKLGTGEYLDKREIEKAKVLAEVTGRTLNRLPVRKITLSGFVVDADPFIQWFDPRRLRAIHFKNDCIDAGFYLPKSMRKVNITFPREGKKAILARRLDLFNDLNLIELKAGKTAGKVPYRFVRTGLLNGDGKGGKKGNRSMSTPPVFRTSRPSGDAGRRLSKDLGICARR